MNNKIAYLVNLDCLETDYLFSQTIETLFKQQSNTEKKLSLFYKSKKLKK